MELKTFCGLCGRPEEEEVAEGKPCKKCEDMMKKGYLLVGVVNSKTTDKKNPYRSGNTWVIKSEMAEKMFEPENYARGACFIDVNDALSMGLPNVNLNNNYDAP